jgi:hypothetical protein
MKRTALCMVTALLATTTFVCAQLPSTNTQTRTILKLQRVQMGVKLNKDSGYPCVSFDYSMSVSTSEPRIKKPYVTCYYLIQKKDTTRSGRVGAKNNDNWSGKISREMNEVAANTIRQISDTLVGGSPGVPRDAKVLIGRLEVWLDGALVAQWESLNAEQMARLGLKEDWYK